MLRLRSFRLVYCLTVLLLVVGMVASIAPMPVAVAQASRSFFTIVFVPDIHWDYLDGSPNSADRVFWNRARAWIETHTNDSIWNIRGGVDLGDIVSENNGASPADWATLMGHFQHFWDIGLPFVIAPGNHDTFYPAQAAWDSNWGARIKSWMTSFPSIIRLAADDYFPYANGGGAYTPTATTQYARVDVPTTVGTIKIAMATGAMFTSAAALNQLKTITDGDTDRNVVFGTHMFLAPTYAAPVTNADVPCVKNSSLCASTNFSALQSGEEMWSQMKTWPRLVGIANGHTHVETGNLGVHSALLTGNAGNPVQAVSSYQVGVRGNIILAKFRTDNRTIEWYSWNTCTNYPTCTTEGADNSAWGAPLVTPWSPLISSAPPRVTAVVNAASSQPGPVCSGQFVSLYGAGLGPTAYATGWQKGLGGSKVFFNGIEAWMTLASDGQLNTVVPYGISGSADLVVEFNGKTASTFPVTVTDSAPGIFTWQTGLGPAVITVNGAAAVNPKTNAVARGDVISFWATGQGPVTPRGQDGEEISGSKTLMLPYKVTIGGVDAPVQFIGLTYTGVTQVNVLVPPNAPTGLDELLLTIGNAVSRPGVTIAVQ